MRSFFHATLLLCLIGTASTGKPPAEPGKGAGKLFGKLCNAGESLGRILAERNFDTLSNSDRNIGHHCLNERRGCFKMRAQHFQFRNE